MNSYQQALEERKKQHLLRTLPRLDGDAVDLYSNDYLGLAKSSDFLEEINKSYNNTSHLNGATGSRLLSGNSAVIEAVELQIANFHHVDNALIYSSGYTANIGLISCLATRGTTLVYDELVHASLIDGGRLGHSPKIRFKHNDLQDLSEKLEKTKGQKIVIVESVYSMDGDVCPLQEVVALCKTYHALLIVDEAHAIGVMGKEGEGLVQHLGLENDVMARIMTYGKAPGIHGAAIVGPQWLKDYQINFSRSAIFSTAPSPHQVASIEAFYKHTLTLHQERKALQKVINHFVKKRLKNQMQWIASNTHIQSLIVPGNEHVLAVSEKLTLANINVLPIRSPSVAKGAERIRFCLHSYNTAKEIDLLFDTLDMP